MFQTSSLSFDRYLIEFLYVLSKISTQLLSILFASNNSLNCFIVEYLYKNVDFLSWCGQQDLNLHSLATIRT